MSDESQEVWEATMPQEDEIEPLELKIAEPIKLKK
jgi:hypothetical protein